MTRTPAMETARVSYNNDTDALTSALSSLTLTSPVQPFRFFDLPSEIRLRIYEEILCFPNETLDLDPKNYRRLSPLVLRLFLASHRVHEEAYRVFYGQNTFRLFPVHGRFFHTKYPLLMRLPKRYREVITSVELRLGPGWTAPPKCWSLSTRLGLPECKALRRLNIFIECDPASDIVFNGFRGGKSETFYTEFCGGLVRGLIAQVQSLEVVQFDAWSSVKRNSPLMKALIEIVEAQQKKVEWGPVRKWSGKEEENLVGMLDEMMKLL